MSTSFFTVLGILTKVWTGVSEDEFNLVTSFKNRLFLEYFEIHQKISLINIPVSNSD